MFEDVNSENRCIRRPSVAPVGHVSVVIPQLQQLNDSVAVGQPRPYQGLELVTQRHGNKAARPSHHRQWLPGKPSRADGEDENGCSPRRKTRHRGLPLLILQEAAQTLVFGGSSLKSAETSGPKLALPATSVWRLADTTAFLYLFTGGSEEAEDKDYEALTVPDLMDLWAGLSGYQFHSGFTGESPKRNGVHFEKRREFFPGISKMKDHIAAPTRVFKEDVATTGIGCTGFQPPPDLASRAEDVAMFCSSLLRALLPWSSKVLSRIRRPETTSSLSGKVLAEVSLSNERREVKGVEGLLIGAAMCDGHFTAFLSAVKVQRSERTLPHLLPAAASPGIFTLYWRAGPLQSSREGLVGAGALDVPENLKLTCEMPLTCPRQRSNCMLPKVDLSRNDTDLLDELRCQGSRKRGILDFLRAGWAGTVAGKLWNEAERVLLLNLSRTSRSTKRGCRDVRMHLSAAPLAVQPEVPLTRSVARLLGAVFVLLTREREATQTGQKTVRHQNVAVLEDPFITARTFLMLVPWAQQILRAAPCRHILEAWRVQSRQSVEILDAQDTSDPELVVVPTGRVASSKGGVVEDVPPAPPLMIEEKLNLLIHLVEQQSNELQKVHHRVAAVEEKLTQLSQAEAPRGALSFISRHSRRLNSKASKAETSMSSKAVSDFNDIDELVGQRVMKAAMKSRQDDNKGGAIYKRSGTYHIGASQNFAASFAMSRKVSFGPGSSQKSLAVQEPVSAARSSRSILRTEDNPGSVGKTKTGSVSPGDMMEVAGASSEAGKSKISSKEHCASLRDVFKHRETQLVPVSPTGTTGTSMRVPTGFQQEEEYVPSGYGASVLHFRVLWMERERGASCFLACCDAWTRLCGLTPLVQQWIENPEEDCEDLDPWMMLVSKAYHCLVLSLSCVGVWATATRLSVCSSGSDIDPCASGPATDVAIAFGATLAIASCGGLRHYFKSAQMQIQINEHLLASVESEGLMSHLRRQKTTDGFVTVLLWIAILAARLGFYSLQPEFNGHLARALVPHAFASAALLGACYLQVACWRGVSLTIVAFARSLLSGHIRGQGARAKWREMTSCMRQASRMYQLSAAALALTAVLVVFTSLFDVHQGLMADILPNLVVAGSLLRSLYVAASATAHCTRLPSFVSMLDGGEEDMELEYMNLSLYLSLSESGFFMWDTRVTLGVLQKFVYFSIAIVGTIGFQLNVLHF
ncbi:hypothetical protein AK812_SmicGene42 [Symbiodinium microadriaticum]|uniref:Uncharacterized protein n=1 Tax=Symbiodinium microadriaticum TaxID=2951 RepID=A0A1Q9F7H0_SYMMI|nr:hypothetical protein AK812_SmicGene42 [Symbiodinium microadriaticum]